MIDEESESEANGAPPGDPSSLMAAVGARELAELRARAAEVEALREQHLRVNADLQNLRRRADRDVEDRARRKTEPLLVSLLETLDELDRAIETAEKAKQPSIANGVRLIRDRLKRAAEREGVKEIPSVGGPFDPKHHEAVTTVAPPKGTAPGMVIAEQRKGYLWGDRVLRPAQVVVSESPPSGRS
ncbi:MAG TPA: nucleotide exchange factor GrpE [Planctomycetota bacterium]|nr:nucleotide exchange factor GrpE [Planctomycetota bacterium]